MPLHWDARPRDAEIAYVKAFVDARVAAGERVVLMGDFNVTDREPANAELSRGLRDAHDVAWGAGASWGPLSLRRHGLALIRIDRILAGPGTVPTAFEHGLHVPRQRPLRPARDGRGGPVAAAGR